MRSFERAFDEQPEAMAALIDLDNWSPFLTKISKDTGRPVSTLHDLFVKHEKDIRSILEARLKSRGDIEALLEGSLKDMEKALGVQFRNGQGTAAAKAALRWCLNE